MKIRRQGGFSLMEMMVVLLIIAIVLAATTPMVSRRMARVSEGGSGGCNWRPWSDGIYYGDTSTENVLIGAINLTTSDKAKLNIVSSDKPHILLSEDDNGTGGMYLYVNDGSAIFTDDKLDANESVIIGKDIGIQQNSSLNQKLVAIGTKAEALGTYATALGYDAHANNNYSIAIGEEASADTEKSKGSIAIGYKSMAIGSYDDGTGENEGSIAIGNGSIAFGEKSVAIGARAKTKDPEQDQAPVNYAVALGADAIAGQNQIVLGGTGSGHDAPQKVIIPGDLEVHGNVRLAMDDGKRVYIQTYSGSNNQIYDAGDPNYSSTESRKPLGIIPPSTTSDRRLKDVGEVFKGGIEELKKLDLYHFTFKNDSKKIPHVGVMAQDLQKIFPDAVITGEDGFLKIRMEDMFYAVINAVKELDTRLTKLTEQVKSNLDLITALQEKITAQEQEINELKNQNAEFEKRLAKLEKKAGKKEK